MDGDYGSRQNESQARNPLHAIRNFWDRMLDTGNHAEVAAMSEDERNQQWGEQRSSVTESPVSLYSS